MHSGMEICRLNQILVHNTFLLSYWLLLSTHICILNSIDLRPTLRRSPPSSRYTLIEPAQHLVARISVCVAIFVMRDGDLQNWKSTSLWICQHCGWEMRASWLIGKLIHTKLFRNVKKYTLVPQRGSAAYKYCHRSVRGFFFLSNAAITIV